MFRQARKTLASSISVIQEGEDFLYNSAIRAPLHKPVPIGNISYSGILDSSNLTFEFEKPFLSKPFFKLSNSSLFPEDVNYFISKKVKINTVFFQLLYVSSKIKLHSDIEPKPSGYSAKLIKFQMKKAGHSDVDVKLNEPEIKDYLQNLKTKVEKFELLKMSEFFSEGKDTNIKEINIKDFNNVTKEINIRSFGKLKVKKLKSDGFRKFPKLNKIEVPGIEKHKASVTTLSLQWLKKAAVSSPQLLDFASTHTIDCDLADVLGIAEQPIEIPDEMIESVDVSEQVEFVEEKIESEVVSEQEEIDEEINESVDVTEQEGIVLETSPKVEWENRQDPILILNEFEDNNARFLVENKRAFLAEEPGLNKIKESFAALKFLFENGVISSTLIVIPAGFLGHSEEAKQLGVSNGWIGNLEKYCYDMSYSVISGDDDERVAAWKKSTLIHFVDHKTFINDYSYKILDKHKLSNFDCVIIDEVQELFESGDKSESALKEINSKIFWALSSIVGDNILSSLNNYLNDNCKIEQRKVRFLTDGAEEDPVINHEEFWLEPNVLQRIEYKENFVECRKDLKKVLESGNPFRYQSNIFTLVHKLFQIQNFSKGNDASPKSDLLIQHIKAIEKNLKKVIVISQYDRQGTKNIERLFDLHKINYITVPISMSGEEIEKSVSLFKSKKSITVFLTNAKISRLDFKDFIVPYIIRFDSWWNPALLWQTKNLFNMRKSQSEKNVINVFTYKMLNTIDELIKRVLVSKNYMDDNIISAMPPSTINDLIVIDDWLKVFDMPVEDNREILQKLYEETIENLNNLSLKDYKATLTRFLFTIGYTKIDIKEHKNSDSFDISGEGKSGNQIVNLTCKVLSDEIITRKVLKQIISDVSKLQKNNTFVITRGNFEKGCSEIAKNKLTLLDVEKIAAYLVNLQLVQPSTE
jgi:hypothetical protein